jgi:hypothetical protein
VGGVGVDGAAKADVENASAQAVVRITLMAMSP